MSNTKFEKKNTYHPKRKTTYKHHCRKRTATLQYDNYHFDENTKELIRSGTSLDVLPLDLHRNHRRSIYDDVSLNKNNLWNYVPEILEANCLSKETKKYSPLRKRDNDTWYFPMKKKNAKQKRRTKFDYDLRHVDVNAMKTDCDFDLHVDCDCMMYEDTCSCNFCCNYCDDKDICDLCGNELDIFGCSSCYYNDDYDNEYDEHKYNFGLPNRCINCHVKINDYLTYCLKCFNPAMCTRCGKERAEIHVPLVYGGVCQDCYRRCEFEEDIANWDVWEWQELDDDYYKTT